MLWQATTLARGSNCAPVYSGLMSRVAFMLLAHPLEPPDLTDGTLLSTLAEPSHSSKRRRSMPERPAVAQAKPARCDLPLHVLRRTGHRY